MTNADIIIKTFKTIYSNQEMGTASANGRELSDCHEAIDFKGILPAEIIWSTDRGNWTWDGALAALDAMGVQTSQHL